MEKPLPGYLHILQSNYCLEVGATGNSHVKTITTRLHDAGCRNNILGVEKRGSENVKDLRTILSGNVNARS